MKTRLAITAILGGLLAGTLHADIVKPISATTNIAGDAGSNVLYLLNDNPGFAAAGLVDSTLNPISLENGDSLLKAACSFGELSGGGQAESWTAVTGAGNPIFVFDLTGGGDTPIGSIVLWQYGNNGGGWNRVGNHTRDFELIFHTDAEGAVFDFGTEAVEFNGTMQPGLEEGVLGTAAQNPAQVFFFGAQETVRYVALRIATNYLPPADPRIIAGGDRYGLGEVRFATEASLDPELDTVSDLPILSNGEPFRIIVPILNNGATQDLNVTDARVTGLDAAAFTVNFDTTLVVPPGDPDSTITIDVDPSVLTPGVAIEALFEIDSDGTIKPTLEIPITGVIRNPWIDTVGNIDLTTIPPVPGTQAFSIEVSNLGFDTTLNVTDAFFTGLEFTVVEDIFNNPLAIAPGSSATINLNFDAGGAAGPFADILTLVSNDPIEPNLEIPVSILVERDPEISAPAVVNAGPFAVGTGPHVIQVPIQNLGVDNVLEITPDPVVFGGDETNFMVGMYASTVGTGGTGFIDVQFDPAGAAGCFTTTLEIESNDIGVPFTTDVQIVATVLPQALPGGLVAWWSMDNELDPGNDDSGNGFHGTAIGTNTAVAGATANTGGALNFADGDNNWIDVPWCEFLNPASFTVVGWACPTGTGGIQSFITSRYDDNAATANTYGYIFYIIGGQWDFWNGTAPGGGAWATQPSGAPTAGTWQHIAFSYDANTNTKTVYINGAIASQAAAVQPYQRNPLRDLHLGGGGDDGTSFGFTGKLDDMAIFSTVLSQDDINTIINDGVSGFLNPVVALDITNVSYDGTNLVVDVTGAEPGKDYKITSSTTLTAPWADTGVTFTDATATGLVINSPVGTNPALFIRAEEVVPVP